MSAYVDTSVVLAKYIPTDPDRVPCRKFFQQTKIKRLASSLCMLELTCIFSRLLDAREVEVPSQIEALLTELSYGEKVHALVEYALKDCDLRIVDVDPIPLTISVLGSPTKIAHTYLKALSLASQLRLKTLDTLHLAHVSCLKDEGVRIEYLVTNDMEVVSRKERISEILQTKVVSVEEALRL